MSTIYGLNGRPIAETVGAASNRGKVTKSQASAIVISEIDMAIAKFNEAAIGQHLADKKAAPLFEAKLDKYEYAEKAKEASGYFGYTLFRITLSKEGKTSDIYTKAVQFKTAREMENMNGYFPEVSFDCIGFLIASGLMYNLALQDLQNQNEKTETKEDPQPGSGHKSKRTPGRVGKPGGRNSSSTV